MPVYDFAVYSSDDGSLTLYHRRRILLPLKGMVFEGKRVTACFRIGREDRDHGWTADSKCKKAVSVLVADTGIKPKKIDHWFSDFRNLRSADLSKLDTSDVQHAGGLFCGCEHLGKVLMPAIGLPSAIRTACMFRGCRSLTSLDMAGYDLHSAVDLHHMFSECLKLEQAGASTWNIPRASDVNKMFFGCQNLHEDLRRWQLPHLTLSDDFNRNSPGVLSPDCIERDNPMCLSGCGA